MKVIPTLQAKKHSKHKDFKPALRLGSHFYATCTCGILFIESILSNIAGGPRPKGAIAVKFLSLAGIVPELFPVLPAIANMHTE